MPPASVIASQSAMNAPLMDAVRVPPSAWITSQSIVNVRSPITDRSTAGRGERPISLCISCVLPRTLPARRFTPYPLRRGAREHPVLRGEPADALVPHHLRNLLLDCRGADYLRVPHLYQHGAGRALQVTPRYLRRAHLVQFSSIKSIQNISSIPVSLRFSSPSTRSSSFLFFASNVAERRIYAPASSQGTVEINFSLIKYPAEILCGLEAPPAFYPFWRLYVQIRKEPPGIFALKPADRSISTSAASLHLYFSVISSVISRYQARFSIPPAGWP